MYKDAAPVLIGRKVINGKCGMPRVHYHEEHELYYMVKGSTTYYIGDKIFHIQQGDFVFIPKGILHKTDYEDNVDHERILLNFSDQMFGNELLKVKEELCNCRVLYLQKERLPYLEALMEEIEREYYGQKEYRSVMLHLYITELLVQLCRYKQDNKPQLSGMDQTLYQISKYISTNFREEITLKELSREFSMSESHLSRKFKAYTGIGISEYITYVRITNAEKMLRETNMSVAEVARQCGYDDSNYFSTVFKRIKGVTPRAMVGRQLPVIPPADR